jgi:hypothetical protein
MPTRGRGAGRCPAATVRITDRAVARHFRGGDQGLATTARQPSASFALCSVVHQCTCGSVIADSLKVSNTGVAGYTSIGIVRLLHDGEDQLNIAQTEAEYVIKPNNVVADDLGGKPGGGEGWVAPSCRQSWPRPGIRPAAVKAHNAIV